MSVPTFTSLDFYNDKNSQVERYKAITDDYKSSYGKNADFISRAPGRVNLIGEHIDYCNFSVLPMAIEYDVVEAIGVVDSPVARIAVKNTDPEFTSEEIIIPSDGSVITIDITKSTWTNYYKCALIVAHKFILEKYPELLKGKLLKSMNVIVDGRVPTGGGLSSSAALCVASTLGILHANGINDVTKVDLTRITAVSEHYVGLNNGGMDQCASVCGEKNKVLFIEFTPEIRATPYAIPEIKPPTKPLAFLITNSLVKANKTESAPVNYNLRVVEVAVGADILSHINKVNPVRNSNLKTATLRGFMDEYFTQKGQPAWNGRDIDIGISRLTEMVEKVETWFTKDEKIGFTTEQAATRLGISEASFRDKYLKSFPVRYNKLKVYQRSKHVFTEALRVLKMLKLFTSPELSSDSTVFLHKFGGLLNASQNSLRDLFNNSCDECNQLQSIALGNGSLGSRITGAGFGGSLVHLTTEDRLDGLIEALKKKYYRKWYPNITETELANAIVVSKPATGSCIVDKVSF